MRLTIEIFRTGTYMRVEYLYPSQNRMEYDKMGSSFPNHPVPSTNIDWLSVEGIRMYPRFYDGVVGKKR
jgi:hypothetical protein